MKQALKRLLYSFINKTAGSFGFLVVRKREGFAYVPDYFGRVHGKLYDIREDTRFSELAKKAMVDKRTMLNYERLFTFYQLLLAKPEADVVECGTCRGGNLFFLASLSKGTIYGIDTFEGHAKEDLSSEEIHTAGGHAASFEDVQKYLVDFPSVHLLKGRVQDVAPSISDKTFDVVHLDMDLYAPTIFGLDFFYPRLKKDGVIVLDDYVTTCPGVKKAIDEFCGKNRVQRLVLNTGQCIIGLL